MIYGQYKYKKTHKQTDIHIDIDDVWEYVKQNFDMGKKVALLVFY